MNDFRCRVCDVLCSGPEPYQEHMGGSKHKRNENRALIVRSLQSSNAGLSNDFPDQHIRPGTDDLDNVARPLILADRCVESENPDLLMNLSDQEISRGGFQRSPAQLDFRNHMQTNYFCHICQIPCSGPEPFKQHIESMKHIKKKNLQRPIPGLSQSCNNTSDHTMSNTLPDRCIMKPGSNALGNSAKPPFLTGKENSDPVTNACDQQNGLGCLQRTGTSTLFDYQNSLMNNYFCSVCNTPCSGPYPYEQHLIGKSHLRKMKLLNLPSSNGISDPAQNVPSGASTDPFQNVLSGAAQNASTDAFPDVPSGAAHNASTDAFPDVPSGAAQNASTDAFQNVLSGAAHNTSTDAFPNIPSGAAQNASTDAFQNVLSDALRHILSDTAQDVPSDVNDSAPASRLPECRPYLTEQSFIQGSEQNFASSDAWQTYSNPLPSTQDSIWKPQVNDSYLLKMNGTSALHDKWCNGYNSIAQKYSPTAVSEPKQIDAIEKPSFAPNVHPLMNYNCELCQIVCSGPDQHRQHMQGKLHAKKTKLLGVDPLANNHPENTLPSTYGQTIPPTSANNLDPVLISGNVESTEPLLAELKNLSIKEEWDYDTVDATFPTKQETCSEEMAKTNLAPVDLQTANLMKYRCEYCDVLCTGVEPYKAHVQGKQHKKNLARRTVYPEGDIKNTQNSVQVLPNLNNFSNTFNPTNLGIHVVGEDDEIVLDGV